MERKTGRKVGCLVVVGITALVWNSQVAGAKELKYVGSSTIGTFMADAKGPFKAKTGINLVIDTGPESGGGETTAVAGTADLGGVARDPKPEVLKEGVVCTLLGKDAIAVIANKGNPLRALTTAQIKGIFTGKIRNWNEVGGPDEKVVAFVTAEKSATRDVFQKLVLRGEEYSNVQVQTPDSSIPGKVAGQKGAIGQISFSFLVGKSDVTIIAPDGQKATVDNFLYPIARPLNLCTKGEPKGDAKTFIDWALSPEGQTLVKKYFVGVK